MNRVTCHTLTIKIESLMQCVFSLELLTCWVNFVRFGVRGCQRSACVIFPGHIHLLFLDISNGTHSFGVKKIKIISQTPHLQCL